MPRTLTLLLALTLLLSACGPTATPPATGRPASPTPFVSASQARSTSPADSPVPSLVPTLTLTPKPLRNASFVEITDLVEMRAAETDAFAAAAVGAQMEVGGEARTNDTGKARLDLLPDGTILRLPPNSSFKLNALQGDRSSPVTRLGLFFGKIFVILSGGELEVETPSGVAAVRGSMMSVYYNPETGALTATCLEGHCSLRNDKGTIELIEGQAADIRGGVLSAAPRALTDAELLDWLNFVPETDRVLDRLPRLRQLRDRIREIIPPRRRP